MTDLVARLRDYAVTGNRPSLWPHAMREAADEIERLRGPVAVDHQQCIDYWADKAIKAEHEIERLRAENLALHNLHHDAINDIERLREVLTEALGGTWHLALTAGHET